MLPDKVYQILKWVALIFIPALVVLIQTVGGVWGWPYINEITVTLGAIGLFLGSLIGVSTIQYNKKVNDNGDADR